MKVHMNAAAAFIAMRGLSIGSDDYGYSYYLRYKPRKPSGKNRDKVKAARKQNHRSKP